MWNGVFMSGTACPPNANALHSPILAGYLIRAAQASGDDSLKSFALGYSTHVVSDEVGFATGGGYLGNLSAIIDWSTEWPFMLAIDAYILQEGLYSDNTFPTTPVTDKNMQFLAQVVQQYAGINPHSPSFNTSQLEACSSTWAPAVNQMNQLSAMQDAASTAKQLIFFDRFGATTIEQTAANLVANWACVQKTLTTFVDALLNDAATTPEQAWSTTAAYIAQSFEQGLCTVQAKPAKHQAHKPRRILKL